MTPLSPIPLPPEHLLDGFRARFEPAPELAEWLAATFIAEDSPELIEEHSHLRSARLGVLWTNVQKTSQQRRVIGTAEIFQPRGKHWVKDRQEVQMLEWFGGPLPDFIITLDARYVAEALDRSAADPSAPDGIPAVCALLDHELSHCGQAVDAFGMPRFNSTTGRPIYSIVGHDVEEFVGVVRRWGADAAGVRELVDAAIEADQEGPLIAHAKVSGLCGTCLRTAA